MGFIWRVFAGDIFTILIICSVSQFQALDYWDARRKKGHVMFDLETIAYYVNITQGNKENVPNGPASIVNYLISCQA